MVFCFQVWDSINPCSGQTLRNSAGTTTAWPRLICKAFRQGVNQEANCFPETCDLIWVKAQGCERCGRSNYKPCQTKLDHKQSSSLRPSLSSRLDTNCSVISLNIPNFGKQVLSSGIQLDLAFKLKKHSGTAEITTMQ